MAPRDKEITIFIIRNLNGVFALGKCHRKEPFQMWIFDAQSHKTGDVVGGNYLLRVVHNPIRNRDEENGGISINLGSI